MAKPAVRVLLDTHVVIWALTEPTKLSRAARAVLEDLGNELAVSAASAWELGTKFRLGKLPGLEATVVSYSAQLARLGAVSVPVSAEDALLAGTMAWVHGDPFDRMLAAQAMINSVALVTSDAVFSDLPGLETLW